MPLSFKRACLAAALISCLTAPAVARAEPSGAATIPEAITRAAESGSEAWLGLAALKERGAEVGSLLTMEALPEGGLAAEIEVRFKGYAFRYPIKLKRLTAEPSEACASNSFALTWAPDEAYTRALLNVVSAGALPGYDGVSAHQEWVDMARLPALGLVVTAQKIFTPYGAIAWSDLEGELDSSAPGAEVAPPQALSAHTRRWIQEYFEGEPGAAAVDLIADKRVSWQQLNRLVFGVSALGLYDLNLLVADASSGSLKAVESAAPIASALNQGEHQAPLVLGYYPLAPGQSGAPHGWRVSQGEALLSGEQEAGCDQEMSFCTEDVEAFAARFSALSARMREKKPGNPSFALFAATKEVTLEQAMPFLQLAAETLGVAPGRVLIGYIKR